MSGPLPAIDLTRQGDFALGPLTVQPATLQVTQAEQSETLEPRVMQVLVALHLAAPSVISRDDLIAQCWEGRIVGEDAINRAIGRLRKLADATGAFSIETIPRVGYRLLVRAPELASPAMVRPEARPTAPSAAPTSRRTLLYAGAAAVAAGGAGLWFWSNRPKPAPSLPEDIAYQIDRAKQAMRQGTPDTEFQGARLLEHVVQIHPEAAPAWGLLAISFAAATHYNPAESEAMRLRAEAAIRQARAIDPHEPGSYVAEAYLLPNQGYWGQRERLLREGLSHRPHSDDLLLPYGFLLYAVGRVNEAADQLNRAVAAATQLDPSLSWLQISTLDAAGRLVEADQAAAAGIQAFPRHIYVWFSRLYLLMYSGRFDQALATLADIDSRPVGVPMAEFDNIVLVAQALKSKTAAGVDRALAANIPPAHSGAGFAENLMNFSSALGRLDLCFEVANGLYFDRGFAVGELRFSPEQAVHTPRSDRRTEALFRTPSKAMRHDPRFAGLVSEIGLARYWRDAGVKPDYQRDKGL